MCVAFHFGGNSCLTDKHVSIYGHPGNVCAVRDLLGGASFVSLAGQHT